ncbi:TetR/AcrR family transcriptional regulator [Nocardia sp. GCM10030253]|uniref:TetR/AcrR family transcriptional regulator n=1 Tax=Nocardia sp. GCM10030253 TaxID=3273404 RepID=UPI0036253AFB
MTTRREGILDAARGLIVRDGYASISMHAIARAAGVTRPAVYAEFGDRDALFAALLAREEERVLAMAAASTPELAEGTDLSTIDVAALGAGAVETFLDQVLSAPETWQFVLMPGDGLPPAMHERVEQGRNAIRERNALLFAVIAALVDRELDTEMMSHASISVSETAARIIVREGGRDQREALSKTMRWMTRRMVAGVGIEKG